MKAKASKGKPAGFTAPCTGSRCPDDHHHGLLIVRETGHGTGFSSSLGRAESGPDYRTLQLRSGRRAPARARLCNGLPGPSVSEGIRHQESNVKR